MNIEIFKGRCWIAKKVEEAYMISIKDGSSIVEALTDFVSIRKIQAGQITGIGAVSEATLRFFVPSAKSYIDKTFNEQMEVSNISGNISMVEGTPLLHLHITLGRQDYTALAGHLLDAKIRGAGEFMCYPLDTEAIKIKDKELGINLYDFEKE